MEPVTAALIMTGVSAGIGGIMGKSQAEDAEAAAQRKNMAIQLSALSARRARDLQVNMLRDQAKLEILKIEQQSDQIQARIRVAAAAGKGGNIRALQKQAELEEHRVAGILDEERRKQERSASLGLRDQIARLAGMVQSPQAAGAAGGLAGFQTGAGIGMTLGQAASLGAQMAKTPLPTGGA